VSGGAAKRRLPLVGLGSSSSGAGGAYADEAVREAVARESAAILRDGGTALDVAAHALPWLDDTLTAARSALPPARELACVTGCAHCCYLKVTLTQVEALVIAGQLRKTYGAPALARLKRRVKETDARTRGLSAAARLALRLPCPLLDEERRCMVYEVRPLSCAGTNSFDAEGCARAVESGDDRAVASYEPQLRAASAIAAGITDAVAYAGRDPRIVELVAALRILLDDPDAKSKWMRGLPVLGSAVDAEFASEAMRGG
jgi:hypothetical protein